MPRQRYDTEALVVDLKRERKRSMILLGSGLGVVALLAAYFSSVRVDVPVVPNEPPPVAQVKPLPAPPTPAPAAVAVEPPPAPAPQPPPAPTHAKLTFELPPKSTLVLDNKPVAMEAELLLEPGKRVVKVKIGKKVLPATLEVEAGKTYTLGLDAKKKRLLVKVL